jgi:hypothetical protein
VSVSSAQATGVRQRPPRDERRRVVDGREHSISAIADLRSMSSRPEKGNSGATEGMGQKN